MAVEEIRGLTYDFAGAKLKPWQVVQRLYQAGFTDARELAIGYAVMKGESGHYLKAWHHNVVRNTDGTIKRTPDGLMTVKSTDLGFIQRNVLHSPHVLLPTSGEQSRLFVDDLFDTYPRLARGDESAKIAFALYEQRGWQPWYAHTNGSYKRSLPQACVAVANFLDRVLLDGSGHEIARKVRA